MSGEILDLKPRINLAKRDRDYIAYMERLVSFQKMVNLGAMSQSERVAGRAGLQMELNDLIRRHRLELQQ